MSISLQTRSALAVTLAAFGFSWGFIIVEGVGLPPSAVAFYRTWIGALGAGLDSEAVRRGRAWIHGKGVSRRFRAE